MTDHCKSSGVDGLHRTRRSCRLAGSDSEHLSDFNSSTVNYNPTFTTKPCVTNQSIKKKRTRSRASTINETNQTTSLSSVFESESQSATSKSLLNTTSTASTHTSYDDQPKSLFIAYLYLLLGGWFGLHHWYLRRDEHALLYCMSFGGFGFGCLHDLWRLPSYVREANQSDAYIAEVCLLQRSNPEKPPRTESSRVAQWMFAFYFGELFSQVFNLLMPIPEPTFPSLASVGNNWVNWVIAICRFAHLLRLLSVFLRGVGVAFGVWFVGNLSRIQTAPFGPILVTQLCFSILQVFHVATEWNPPKEIASLVKFELWAVVSAGAWYERNNRWSPYAITIVPNANDLIRVRHETSISISTATPPPYRSSRQRRWFRLITSLSLFTLLMSNYVVLTVRHNPEFGKFLQGLPQNCWQQWTNIQSVGYERWWQDLKGPVVEPKLSPREAAYETLCLDPKKADGYSVRDLRRVRNKLALKYHPDKADTEGLTPAEREVKFAEIQGAYEMILKDKEDRKKTPNRDHR